MSATTDRGLTAFSAQIGYIVLFKSMLQLKSENNEKLDNVTCRK